jgi:hypothetical protein
MLPRPVIAIHRWVYGPEGPPPPDKINVAYLPALLWRTLVRLLLSLHLFLVGPTDAVRLRTFRTWFTLALLCYLIDRSLHPYEWLTIEGFHPSNMARHPAVPRQMPLLPTWAVAPFLVAMYTSVLLLLVRWHTRIMTWIVWCFVVYASNVDIASSFTINKLFTVGYFLLGCAPSPVKVEENGQQVELQSVWPIRIFQTTIIFQYFTAGYCKVVHGNWLDLSKLKVDEHGNKLLTNDYWRLLDSDWLGTGNVLWTQVQGLYCTDLCAWLLRVLPRDAWTWMQHSALAFEIIGSLMFLIPSFWIPIGRIFWACRMPNYARSVGIKGRFYFSPRVIAMLWGFGFQTMIALTMYKLFFFSFQMVTFYLLFFSPSALHIINAWFSRVLSYEFGKKAKPAST